MIYRHLRNARGFFSDYYLGSVFARGKGRGRKKYISDKETDTAYKRFMRIYQRAEHRCPDPSACRERFIRPLYRDVLGFHLGAGEQRIHGLYATAGSEAENQAPLALIFCGAWDEDISAGRAAVTPVKRLETVLAAQGIAYGLVVTGERIRLIRTPGEGPKGAFIEADLAGLSEEDDPESFAAVYRLLHVSQFLADDAGHIPLRQVEKESREHAEKVSEDLKRAVFTAAESLTHGLLADATQQKIIEDALRLGDDQLKAFRDAALTALYRILFILYAEARDTRLEEHRIYHRSYSIHGLIEDLVRDPACPWPENRSGIWTRLNALFAIYDQGLPPIDPWEHIPPRGGDFFNAETDQGRILKVARLPDKIVVRMLLDLATTAPRQGVGRERVSFRELDIESLGAVYEGLLEYEPRVAAEDTFEIRVQRKNYALAVDEVLRLCTEKNLLLKGDVDLVNGTPLAALHPDATDEENSETDETDEGFDSDEGDDDSEPAEEEKSLKKGGTARLVRRLPPGHFYFVPGTARKGSGSFYTPLPLVQDIVHHAVGPLVEGRDVADIEALRVLDPACGSAHFLVEAMRFVGRELHRAYVKEYNGKQPPAFTRGLWDDHWQASDEEARAANSEARAWCKRRIAERCLFGVDLNPTAVNLARVALWIESLAGDRPLTYFEHHVRCGNSLLGTWLDRMDLPPLPSMEKGRRAKLKKGKKAGQPAQMDLFKTADEVPMYREDDLFIAPVRQAIQQAAETRRLIDHVDDIRDLDADSLGEQAFKQHQHKTADNLLAAARLLFDLRSASAFVPAIWNDWHALGQKADDLETLIDYARTCPWWEAFQEVRDRERFFHWELEFPEVFLDDRRQGFDAVIGNPPWDKIKPEKKEFYSRFDVLISAYVGGELDGRIRELNRVHAGLGDLFTNYQNRLKTTTAYLKKGGDYQYQDWEVNGKKTGGDPDLFKFFLERAYKIAGTGGRIGYIIPYAFYNNEGCTGLRNLFIGQTAIKRFYGFENRKKIFPIDSRYKFISLVCQKQKQEASAFSAAFMRLDLEELRSREFLPWEVTIDPGELQRLSPGTLAFLEYRNPRERKIILKMYSDRPVLRNQNESSWPVQFSNELHMTNDKDLWTDPKTGKLWTIKQIIGSESDNFHTAREKMATKGFWPLYQDAHVHQYVLEFKPLMRWVSLEAHQKKYDRLPDTNRKLVIRDPARNTDERTVIAAMLPPQSCFGHTLNGIAVDQELMPFLLCVLNSICFDFLARKRVGGQHASPYLLSRNAVPSPPDLVSAIKPIQQIHANENRTWVYDSKTYWDALWQVEKNVAKCYGLDSDEVEFILADFPVFARKRPEFFAYLQTRLAEWKAESGGQAAVVRPYPLAEDSTELPMAAEGNFITMAQRDRANWPSHIYLPRGEAITRPEEVSPEEFAAMVYPATETNKAICAAALAAVEQSPGLSSMDHLDVLLLATHPAWCQTFLDYAGRPAFDAVVNSAPRTLFVNEDQSIRWKECRDYLEQLQAISVHHGDKSQAINLGAGSTSAKSDLPDGMEEVVGYAIRAMKRIAELRKDLSIVPQDQLRIIQAFEEQHRLYQLAA